jgi:hypothetical protein
LNFAALFGESASGGEMKHPNMVKKDRKTSWIKSSSVLKPLNPLKGTFLLSATYRTPLRRGRGQIKTFKTASILNWI